MGAKYWIKLYHEILDDPKMVRLDNLLYRRTIELFLLAGRIDDGGYLPDLESIAFALRIDRTEELETDMIELQNRGILSQIDGRWLVTKFEERQAPMKKAEYMRRKRKQQSKDRYYLPDSDQPVTNGNTEEKRIDKKRGEAGRHFENEIHLLTPASADWLRDWLDQVPDDWMIDAIDEAVKHNARSMKYIDAILKRWQVDGKRTKKKNKAEVFSEEW